MRAQSREDGFTLIELLVVVIIIGILAGIAVPTFLSQRERGWQAQLTSDVRNAVLDAEAGAVMAQGRYPVDQAAFDALGPERSSPTITLTYTVNSVRSEFCVLGRDTRLPAAAQVAHYVSGAGVEVFAACPAFRVP
jgi:prepilin-type N-terminal cleavage/methylation domain-containing protein